MYLTRASAVERARPAEHFALHKPYVGAAQQQYDVAGALPRLVPALLQFGQQPGARGRDPLKFVQRQYELRSRIPLIPLFDHSVQCLPPTDGAEFRK